MSAVIISKLYTSPIGPQVGPTQTGVSRNDLKKGYRVVCESQDVAATYSWSLVFTPDSPGPTAASGDDYAGTPSSAGLLPPEGSTSSTCKFDVDWDGSYLLRLVVDAGLPTEDSQFVRLRVLTTFAELKLPAAGERRDQGGVVPVDATPEGWSDDQNQNIQRLMLLIRRLSSSGRILYVDQNRGRTNSTAQAADDPTNIACFPGPDSAARDESGMRAAAVGFADFSTIGEALAYASAAVARGEPALGYDQPYLIKIRPGIYQEDLNILPFVYLVADGALGTEQVRIETTATSAHHTFAATGAGDRLMLIGVTLANSEPTTDAVLEANGGQLIFYLADIEQTGIHADQGGCLHIDTGFAFDLQVMDSEWGMAHTNNLNAVAIENPTGTATFTRGCVLGPSAVRCISDPAGPVPTTEIGFHRTKLQVSHNAGYSFRGYPHILHINKADCEGRVSVDAVGNPPGSFTHDVDIYLSTPLLQIDSIASPPGISYDSAGTTGTCNFWHGASELRGDSAHDYVEFPSEPGSVPNMVPTTQSRSLFFDNDYILPEDTASGSLNPINQLPTNDVQVALSLLTAYTLPVAGVPYYSLESAYNGLASLWPITMGHGLGRTIQADAGAVQITRALAPVVPFESDLLGGFQVEGQVDVGPLKADGLGSEVTFDPNTFGMGPVLKLGHSVSPSDGKKACALVEVGRSSGDPAIAFDFTVHPRIYIGAGDEAGNVALIAATATDSAAEAGDIHLQAGETAKPLAYGGHVWAMPGIGPNPGRVQIADPSTATNTQLTAAGPFVGGAPDGYIYIQTINGVERFEYQNADNVGTLAARINTLTSSVVATTPAGFLRLETAETGPSAFILYMADDQAGAINTAIGDLSVPGGALYVPGVYGDYCGLSCIGPNHVHVHGQITADVPIGGGGFGYLPMVPPGALVPAADTIIGVQALAGPVVVTLPLAPATPTRLIIKHETGTLAINAVTIDPGPNTIDNAPGPVIYNNPADDRFSLSLYWNGAGWYIY